MSASPAAAGISLIAALDLDGLIGRNGDLPWRLPNDLAHFKRLTLGKIVLMGRKTWDSLGRPLPGRDNWVISRDPAFAPRGGRAFTSPQAAMEASRDVELMVIGGAELYRQTLDACQTLYLTQVQTRIAPPIPGDVHFPAFDRSQFREVACEVHTADARHAYAYRFIRLERT